MDQYYADWLVTSVILFTDFVFWNKFTLATHLVGFVAIASYFYVLNKSKNLLQLATTPMILPVVLLLHYKLFRVAYELMLHDAIGFVGGLAVAIYLVNLPKLSSAALTLLGVVVKEEPKNDIGDMMTNMANLVMSSFTKEPQRQPMVTVKPSNTNFVNDLVNLTEEVSKLAEEMNGESSESEDTMETAD